jgi:hypothetical protein
MTLVYHILYIVIADFFFIINKVNLECYFNTL